MSIRVNAGVRDDPYPGLFCTRSRIRSVANCSAGSSEWPVADQIPTTSGTGDAEHRDPRVLAKMAVTVDHLTGGRLEFGIGAGWAENEHAMPGLEFGTRNDRADRLEESVRRRPGSGPRPDGSTMTSTLTGALVGTGSSEVVREPHTVDAHGVATPHASLAAEEPFDRLGSEDAVEVRRAGWLRNPAPRPGRGRGWPRWGFAHAVSPVAVAESVLASRSTRSVICR